MFKKTMIALMLGACVAGFAQNKEAVPEQPGDSVKTAADIWDKIQEQLDDRKSFLEDNLEDCIAVKAYSDIGASPKSRNYVLNRTLAFEATDFKVKQSISKTLKQTISSAMDSSNVESHGGLSAKALNGNKDLANMINAEIKKELQAQGVDVNNAEAVKKALPRLKGLESFKKRIEITSQSYVMGVVTYASYSTKERVALLAYSNPAQRAIAEGMITGQMKTFKPGKKIRQLINQISRKQLADTYGIRTMINEKGEPTLVAFAQVPVVGSDDAAEEDAQDTAAAMIREFVGTAVALKKATERGRTVAMVQHDEETDAKAIASASSEMKKEAKAEAASMAISGITPSKSGILRLPSKDKVAFAVAFWTPSSAKNAAKAYRQGQRQQKAISKGASVDGGASQTPVTPKRGTKRIDAGSVGEGAVFDAF